MVIVAQWMETKQGCCYYSPHHYKGYCHTRTFVNSRMQDERRHEIFKIFMFIVFVNAANKLFFLSFILNEALTSYTYYYVVFFSLQQRRTCFVSAPEKVLHGIDLLKYFSEISTLKHRPWLL